MTVLSNTHNHSFKINAVRRIVESGEALDVVATELAVSTQNLRSWLTCYTIPVEHESGRLRLKTPKDNLRELHREWELLQQERNVSRSILRTGVPRDEEQPPVVAGTREESPY